MEIKKISKEQANEMLEDMIEAILPNIIIRETIIHSEILKKWEKYLEKTKLEECIDKLYKISTNMEFNLIKKDLTNIIKNLESIKKLEE